MAMPMMNSNNFWLELPPNVFIHILQFLEPLDIQRVASVCKDWSMYAKDDVLWKEMIYSKFLSTRTDMLIPIDQNQRLAVHQDQLCVKNDSYWYEEFQRLYCQTPCKVSCVIDDHKDEVLHVAFSSNGKLMATCSRDCYVGIYKVEGIYVEMYSKLSVGEFWNYPQYAEFSPDDQFLLVSGLVQDQSSEGEIAVYCLRSGETPVLTAKALNDPHFVFGTWLDNEYFLAGEYEEYELMDDHGHSSCSELWAIHRTADITPKKVLSVNNTYQTWVGMVAVSNRSSNGCSKIGTHECKKKTIVYNHGTAACTPHQVVIQEIFWPSLDDDEPSATFDSIQRHSEAKKIETHSRITGLDISPDGRYLYVNCRRWLRKEIDFSNPPEIATDVELRAYDMQSLELVMTHVGHQCFSANTKCFFIFTNVSEPQAASGAEDKQVHIWDRHYGCQVATLPGHTDIVNGVMFNPLNPQMLASASDDHTVRIWVSRNLMKTYKEMKTVPLYTSYQHLTDNSKKI